MVKNNGKVYLVGAGPGDPGLITLKGIEYLSRAEAVVYDRLVNPKLIRFIPKGAKAVYVGKSSHGHTFTQDKINALLVRLAKQGKLVVRLKGGDPFLFGRGSEEALFLAKNKVNFEVVPGVSSATAVAAYAGIPLTHRRFTSSVGIFTGHEDPAKDNSQIEWDKIATGLGTLVFLMGVENLSKIVGNLVKSGCPESKPCCLIQWGTLPVQRSVSANLKTIVNEAKKNKIRPPAVLVVGKVVSLREEMNWYEHKPLFGKRVLLTSSREETIKLAGILEGYGAACVELPLINIRPLQDYAVFDALLKKIEDFQWVIFTSQNGVRFFKQRLDKIRKDIRILKGIKIASIGPKTKLALENLGLGADIVPKEFSQEGLARDFKRQEIKGKDIIIVRAQEARDVLPKALKQIGARVTIAPVYKTEFSRMEINSTEILKDIDVVCLASSSCAQNFSKVFRNAYPRLKHKVHIATIGPVTTRTARNLGLKVDMEARDYTLEGLAEAILKYYRK